ncbi:glycoside hydrolase domain-containing protein [Neobacillus sp. D3-1R]|uniref:glycoside hydrolase domain-containing protein n=1 Tax=Neobacillus sp. D3-1R TaxID=3445778 RepID=UPI003FA0F208
MKWKWLFSMLIPIIILLILPFLTTNHSAIKSTDKLYPSKQYFPVFQQNYLMGERDKKTTERNNSSHNPTKKEQTPALLWGVDSASTVDAKLLKCTRDYYGVPAIWGRYIGTKDNVSSGLTKTEIDLLHSKKVKVLLIYNHFVDATGYENGKKEAKQAISLTAKLGIPKGKALFADIEPTYPVDSEFIKGWVDELSQSEYRAGIYGLFNPENKLLAAYQNAVSNNPNIQKNTIIWTASPHLGVTNKKNQPTFKPQGPKDSLLFGWQYGIEAKNCNIDTNLFSNKIIPYTW